nr:hypothetical protein [uncultured Sphingomonas sp.]
MLALKEQSSHSLSQDIHDFIRGSDGEDIGAVVDSLQHIGECVIFGGMPRDFARGGRSSFNSDVDIVVDADPMSLEEALGGMLTRKNRFGGYRFRYGRFDFDVWALQNTWAIETGLVAGDTVLDLINTTFFDCDSVIFNCVTGQIEASERFWYSIKNNIVGINLEANPHYIGTLARTLKLLLDSPHNLTNRLARYLHDGVAENFEAVIEYSSSESCDGPPINVELNHVVSYLSGRHISM